MVDNRRVRALNDRPVRQGPVVYWMSRDQRVADNWALLYAQGLAAERQQPLAVAFWLAPTFLEATLRQYEFMLAGLAEVEQELRALGIPFHLLLGDPADGEPTVPERIATGLAGQRAAGAVVTDYGPLRAGRQCRERAARLLDVALLEVDAHNIVPCWVLSGKKEFAAYTLRPKLQRLLDEFLTEFPALQPPSCGAAPEGQGVNWQAARDSLRARATGVLARPLPARGPRGSPWRLSCGRGWRAIPRRATIRTWTGNRTSRLTCTSARSRRIASPSACARPVVWRRQARRLSSKI